MIFPGPRRGELISTASDKCFRAGDDDVAGNFRRGVSTFQRDGKSSCLEFQLLVLAPDIGRCAASDGRSGTARGESREIAGAIADERHGSTPTRGGEFAHLAVRHGAAASSSASRNSSSGCRWPRAGCTSQSDAASSVTRRWKRLLRPAFFHAARRGSGKSYFPGSVRRCTRPCGCRTQEINLPPPLVGDVREKRRHADDAVGCTRRIMSRCIAGVAGPTRTTAQPSRRRPR